MKKIIPILFFAMTAIPWPAVSQNPCIPTKTCMILKCSEISSGKEVKTGIVGYVIFTEGFIVIDIQGPEKDIGMYTVTYISACAYNAQYNTYNIYAANRMGEQILLVFQTEGKKISMSYLNQATGGNYLYELAD